MRFLLAVSLAGCVAGPGDAALPERDLERFEALAQPVLGEVCASPTCHGRPERPLRIFASQRYRADPERLLFDEAIDDDELRLNYERARAFLDDADPERSLLLCKPLGTADGGCEHVGGDPFADRTDRGFEDLRSWVLGEETE